MAFKKPLGGGLVLQFLINAVALYLVAYIIPGVMFENFSAVLVAALLIGLINTFIKPILKVIALPITLVTFGLAAILINILLLYMVALIVPGFNIEGLVAATLSSLLLSIISWVLGKTL